MNLFERLRLFFSGSQPAAPILSPPAIVEQYKNVRGYKAAQPAAPWSDDIKAHNHWVNAEYEQRRLFLITGYQNGSTPLPPHFPILRSDQLARIIVRDVPEEVRLRLWSDGIDPASPEQHAEAHQAAIESLADTILWRESRNADATHQQPLQPLLTPQEVQIAREWSAVKSDVDRLEEHAARRSKPSAAEVLEAAGGNETRAAQLQAKVDELFGKGTDEKGTEETAPAAGR